MRDIRRLGVAAASASGVVALTWAGVSAGGDPHAGHPYPLHRTRTSLSHVHADAGARYRVRELTIPLVDPSRPTISRGMELSASRALTTLVWLPETSRPSPLIVFAPGFSVGPPPYEPLLMAWARHGYVVAAIEFPLTDAAVAGGSLDEGDLQNQAQDVDFVVRALLAPESPAHGSVNPGEVALAGHSDGGETVLVASYRNGAPGIPSVQAVIAMSVRPLDAAGATNPPILITQGDADTTNAPTNGDQAYAAAAPPKYLAILHGGGHLEPLQSGSEWFPTLSNLTAAFLDVYLDGRGSPRTVLAAGNRGFITTRNAPSS